MATIVFKNVTKKYGKSTAINQINLEVKEGEFMVLVGPSGCGKSTLLRLIAGLEEIDEGQLYIDGKMVNDLPPKDRDIAIVFQNYALYPHMTAFENLAFGLKIRGVDKATIKNKVEQVAVTLEITELLQRKPKDMSGGQRQRVAIGRAIVRDPKVFLFDEPLSNLDAKLRTQMRLEIADLHKKLKTTIVYVTHDQVEAMTLGDRVAVMHKGEVSQIGTPQELYKHPANIFVAGFIGSPAMNFIEGKISIEKDHIVFIDTVEKLCISLASAKDFSDQQAASLGCRPEHITIHTSYPSAKACIEATIMHIERTGFESFVFVEASGYKLTIRTTDCSGLSEGMTVWCEMKEEEVHLF
jgi:multiple sugar transport system ATP-binding protein